jgi:hypothetical protein
MSQIINISIDLNLIDKTKIKEVTKKDGSKAKYLDVTIFTKDEKDKYGNDASMTLSQTKDERTSNKDKVYLGNGKVVFSADSVAKNNSNSTSDTDSLPF